jgi:hypothetical protein
MPVPWQLIGDQSLLLLERRVHQVARAAPDERHAAADRGQSLGGTLVSWAIA